MKITKPSYYDTFRCIASHCPDSCCRDWEVLVDPQAAEHYRNLAGSLGEDLRRFLRVEDGDTYLTITDGRCPMWRSDGLCRIQTELGEQALCGTCREFPRLCHDYGSFQEWALELSCPEAARQILGSAPERMVMELPGEEEGDYDLEAMEVLLSTRERLYPLLRQGRPVGETLALVFLFGCQAQGELDGGERMPFDPKAALEAARDMAKPSDIRELIGLFETLEILTPDWKTLLRSPREQLWDERTLLLARYLADRYWLQAVSDYDLYSRVKLLAVLCLLVKYLDGDFVRRAQLMSKEIENNAENVEALLDAAYTHSALTDDKLLGLLLH